VRRFGQIDGGAAFEKELGKPAGVVSVLVSDEDAVQPIQPSAQRFEPPPRFPARKPSIEQEARPLRFDERRIARASRS
jgi:hypothetical protein